MRKLKNSLYLTDPDSWLTLSGETIVIKGKEDQVVGRVPLLNLDEVISFGYRGMSPALMNACMQRKIMVSFMSPTGKFLARLQGGVQGNVFLREEQYLSFQDNDFKMQIAKNCILGKLFNSRSVIERIRRDHQLSVDNEKLSEASGRLKICIRKLIDVNQPEELRAVESEGARVYYSVFNNLILGFEEFRFNGRSRRPPMDPVNAMLSFAYSLLAGLVTGGLESAGLDPYIGCLHVERSGRPAMSLDLMEELRPILADRFVLSLINRKMVKGSDFITGEDGAVRMTDQFRKKFLSEWQNKKKEIITHPFLKEKVEWGIVPLVQSRLLAAHIRGDLPAYPPIFWK